MHKFKGDRHNLYLKLKEKILSAIIVSACFSASNALATLNSELVDANGNSIDDRVEAFLTKTSAYSGGIIMTRPLYSIADSTANTSIIEQPIPLLVTSSSDTDNDGINDFLEVYGYYVNGSTIQGLKRVLPTEEWDAFKLRDSVDSFPVYQWAADAIEESGLIREGINSSEMLLDISRTYQAIYNKFTSNGVPVTHNFLTGPANELGTIASVMAEFAIKYDPSLTYSDGTVIRAFYTDPYLRSSDWDPYSDREEVLGLFGASVPKAPADNPLIGAIPNITTNLTSFTLTDIKELRNTDGTTTNHTDVLRKTKSKSQTHGVSVSNSVEWAPAGFSHEHGITLSSSLTLASSTTTEDRDSFGTMTQSTDVTSENCFSKLQLTLDIDNVGSDKATAIYPKWHLTLGDTIWQTLYGSDYLGNGATLAAAASTQTTVLGQEAGDASCLTLAQTNYLNMGGSIGIITELDSAEVNYLDDDSGVILSGGNWAVYKENYEENLAKIELDVITTKNIRINKAFWVRATNERLPNMKYSIKDVLLQAYQEVSCADIEHAEKRFCLKTKTDGYILFGDKSSIQFNFFNDDGKALDYQDSFDKYNAITTGIDDNLDLSLPSHSYVTIVDLTAITPEIKSIDVITEISNLNAPQNLEIRTVVSDNFGVVSVEFCHSEDNCSPMTPGLGEQKGGTYPKSDYYVLKLSNVTLQGNEFIRASNILENESKQTPANFYLTLIGSLHDQINNEYDKLKDIEIWLKYITQLMSSDSNIITDINRYNLMEDQGIASEKYQALSLLFKEVEDTCSFYNAESVGSIHALIQKHQDCVTAIETYKQEKEAISLRLFNPYKLPLKNMLYANDHGVSNTTSNSIEGEARCDFEDYDVITGIGLNYKTNSNTNPGIRFHYRTIERSGITHPLHSWSDVKIKECGNAGAERSWTDTAYELTGDTDTKINALVDFGWSVKAGNVNKLCVIHQAFDLSTAKMSAQQVDSCNGNWSGVERFSNNIKFRPDNSEGPLSQTINDVGIFAKYSSAQKTSARHFTYEYQYQTLPTHDLVDGKEYRIRSSSGKYLSIKGAENAARTLALDSERGDKDQIWVVEIVNDREFRLQPKDFNGYLSRPNSTSSTGDLASVIAANDYDDITSNYNQHWRISKTTHDGYEITSVVNMHSLSEDYLLLQKRNEFDDQVWIFEPANENNIELPLPFSDNVPDINHFPNIISIGQATISTPLVFADMQTFNGADPAEIEITDVTNVDFIARVAEEKSADSEIQHDNENLGFIIFEAGDINNITGTTIGEAGSLSVNYSGDDSWQAIDFKQTYENPVVIIKLNSNNAGKPIHVRIKEVSNNRVTYKLEKWRSEDTANSTEILVYMVIEAGSYTLENGKTLQALLTQRDHEWQEVPYRKAFNTVPITITQSQTYHGGHEVITRNKNINTASFSIRLQESESKDGIHDTETVGVLAIGL
jgi:hypothetical protein